MTKRAHSSRQIEGDQADDIHVRTCQLSPCCQERSATSERQATARSHRSSMSSSRSTGWLKNKRSFAATRSESPNMITLRVPAPRPVIRSVGTRDLDFASQRTTRDLNASPGPSAGNKKCRDARSEISRRNERHATSTRVPAPRPVIRSVGTRDLRFRVATNDTRPQRESRPLGR